MRSRSMTSREQGPMRMETANHMVCLKSPPFPCPRSSSVPFPGGLEASIIIYGCISRSIIAPSMSSAVIRHDAFHSVADAFQGFSGETFQWGHPRSRFSNSLSWTPASFSSKLSRRTVKSTLPMTSLKEKIIFPSWSWMGWVGNARLGVDDENLEL